MNRYYVDPKMLPGAQSGVKFLLHLVFIRQSWDVF